MYKFFSLPELARGLPHSYHPFQSSPVSFYSSSTEGWKIRCAFIQWCSPPANLEEEGGKKPVPTVPELAASLYWGWRAWGNSRTTTSILESFSLALPHWEQEIHNLTSVGGTFPRGRTKTLICTPASSLQLGSKELNRSIFDYKGVPGIWHCLCITEHIPAACNGKMLEDLQKSITCSPALSSHTELRCWARNPRLSQQLFQGSSCESSQLLLHPKIWQEV